MLIAFFRPIGIKESNETEVIAINEVLKNLFAVLYWESVDGKQFS